MIRGACASLITYVLQYQYSKTKCNTMQYSADPIHVIQGQMQDFGGGGGSG